MDIKTFTDTVVLLPNEISVLLRGQHGIGKSEIIKFIAKNKFDLPVLDRRLSQLTEGDLVGLPHKVEREYQGEKISYATKFLPMEWFVQAIESPHLIFLDELDRACNEVQQSVFELLLDRSIQGNKIHPGCRIYSAINGGEKQAFYNVNTMDLAMLDRVWIADLHPTHEEWCEWAKSVNVHPMIVQFIESNPQSLEDSLEKTPEDMVKVSPSRRSWDRLNKTILKSETLSKYIKTIDMSNEDDKFLTTFRGVCSGFIGYETANLLISFLDEKNKFFTAEDVMDNFDSNKDKLTFLRIEEYNDIISKIEFYFKQENSTVTRDQINNIVKFWFILPKELKLVLHSKMCEVPEHLTLDGKDFVYVRTQFVEGWAEPLRAMVMESIGTDNELGKPSEPEEK